LGGYVGGLFPVNCSYSIVDSLKLKGTGGEGRVKDGGLSFLKNKMKDKRNEAKNDTAIAD
jgi:hypothetical protein